MRPTSDVARAVFADPESRAFEARLARLALVESPILITGETGTGKEVAARQLHALSGRSGPFVAANCAAPGNEQPADWIDHAFGGTLLLDDVGEASMQLQIELLHALRERDGGAAHLGDGRSVPARIIAATGEDLSRASTDGRFRRDLLFRLDVVPLVLRPLRERRADIEPLAQYFLELYREKFGGEQKFFAEEALAALRRYDWPGNIRELDNVVHRSVLLSTGQFIVAADLALLGTHERSSATEHTLASDVEQVLQALAQEWVRDGEPDLLQRATRVIVQTGFDAASGNQVRAAEILGVTRNTLRTQLGHLGIIAPRKRKAGGDSGVVETLRVGTQKFGISTLMRLDRHLTESLGRHGVAVDWHDFPAGPQLVEALRDGRIDICCTGEVPPIVAQADGTDLVYLAYEPAASSSIGLVVRATDPIHSVSDLRGRRVAVNRGANVHLMLVRALESCRLTLGDIQPVYVPPHRYPLPERTDDVSAWAIWDPYLGAVQKTGGFRLLMDGTGLVTNRRFYLARRDFAESRPDVIRDLIDSACRVGAAAARAPFEAATRLARLFGMKSDEIALAMQRIGLGAQRLDESVLQEQQIIANHFYALGLVRRPISVMDAVWRHKGWDAGVANA